MELLSFELTLGLAALTFVAGLAAVRYFSTEETPTVPRVLIQCSLIIGLVTVIGVGAIHSNAEKVDYTAELNSQACELRDDAEPVLQYSDLPPEAQEVFRSALEADGEYTTKTAPSEFQYQTDATVENFVKYDSDCYESTAEPRGSFGTGLLILFLSVAGGGLTAISGFASFVSLLLISFRQRGSDTQ